MDITISPVDGKTVSVTFAQGDISYSRTVNACFDADGAYDEAATKERVDAVALGVAQKIALGVITNEEPAPEPQPEEAPASDA